MTKTLQEIQEENRRKQQATLKWLEVSIIFDSTARQMEDECKN